MSRENLAEEKRKSQENAQYKNGDSGMQMQSQALRKQLTMPLSSQSEDREPAGTQFDETESVLTPPQFSQPSYPSQKSRPEAAAALHKI